MATMKMSMFLLKKPNCAPSNGAPLIRSVHVSSQRVDRHCDQAPIIKRRSGNYEPPIWEFDYIQSLKSNYSKEEHSVLASELKEQISNMMVVGAKERVDQLEFIDDLQRLGISYHFKDEIKQTLTYIHEQNYSKEKDLYTEALTFRLMRQHGYKVSEELFDCFKNEKGEFNCSLGRDTKGLLQLYEASYLLTQGETSLELAREFSSNLLQNNVDNLSQATDQDLKSMVQSALELPIHWRAERPNARWFIDAYERRLDMNPVVLKFAKLDFNTLQSTYQDELKHVSRWWNGTCLAEKLPFARDRAVEAYFLTVGFLFEPQYGHYRTMIAKLYLFITLLDDIYDVYGTLPELKLFTDVIQRWDIEAIDQLPDYMQVFYLALNNLINEMAYNVLMDQGVAIIPYLRKMWKDYSNANLQEATWYHGSYTPTLEEYINCAWITVSGPVILTHAFFLLANPIEKKAVKSLFKYHDIVRSSSIIFRLTDDLATSSEEMKRGDVSKSIQCYMNETGVTEEEARDHISCLIFETWKKVNKERAGENKFPESFIESAVGLGRMSHHVYQHGDGYGSENALIKDRISTSIFDPIP